MLCQLTLAPYQAELRRSNFKLYMIVYACTLYMYMYTCMSCLGLHEVSLSLDQQLNTPPPTLPPTLCSPVQGCLALHVTVSYIHLCEGEE